MFYYMQPLNEIDVSVKTRGGSTGLQLSQTFSRNYLACDTVRTLALKIETSGQMSPRVPV